MFYQNGKETGRLCAHALDPTERINVKRRRLVGDQEKIYIGHHKTPDSHRVRPASEREYVVGTNDRVDTDARGKRDAARSSTIDKGETLLRVEPDLVAGAPTEGTCLHS